MIFKNFKPKVLQCFLNSFVKNIFWTLFLHLSFASLGCPPSSLSAWCGCSVGHSSSHAPNRSLERHPSISQSQEQPPLCHSTLTLMNSGGSWPLERAVQSVLIWMKKPRAELKLVRRGRLYFSASWAIIPRGQKPGKQESPDGKLPCRHRLFTYYFIHKQETKLFLGFFLNNNKKMLMSKRCGK